MENEKNSEQSVDLLRETVEGLRLQFQTLEREKREVGKVVDAIGEGAEKKLREKFEREEREGIGKRVEELLEKEGLFGEQQKVLRGRRREIEKMKKSLERSRRVE